MASGNLETISDVLVSKIKINVDKSDKTKRSFSHITLLSICLSILSIILVIFLFISFYITIAPKFEDAAENTRETGGISKRNTGLPPPHGLLSQSQPGLEAIKLVGQLNSVHMNKTEYIQPWALENEVTWANLSEDKASVIIQRNGLYFVYAQIYYFTNQAYNSYQIENWVKRPKYYKDERERKVLSLCATPAVSVSLTQVSCYTGVIAYLQANDQLCLFQIEPDRIVHLSTGYSHWGVLKLQDIYET